MFIKFFSYCVVIIIFCSCASTKISSSKNYHGNGFISDDCFQIVIHEKPSDNSLGLVEQRESAYFEAKRKLYNIAGNILIDYCINNKKKKEKINLSRKEILNKIEVYSRSGYIASEYYKEDNSVCLVYRITKPGIKLFLKGLNVYCKLKNNTDNGD